MLEVIVAVIAAAFLFYLLKSNPPALHDVYSQPGNCSTVLESGRANKLSDLSVLFMYMQYTADLIDEIVEWCDCVS